ncbi:MAG: type II toxin-antitoxin system PemK/MazF family toxin [Elusimicrobia bacterium]|nr:type II toxin-antitoxin system PemK/MazF family toxin [Elusimicrobiota bacterium]MBP9127170.1 type II toxin-antitoxin system PemK/MazF family toxin [Elusimicrobiota bacterium]
MKVAQGEIWWADLPDPTGSGPGFRRPVAVVQGDPLNRSRIATIVCVPLTSNLQWAEAPGNVFLSANETDLPKDSVANVSQIIALDRTLLTERAGKLSSRQLNLVLTGIDIILGR